MVLMSLVAPPPEKTAREALRAFYVEPAQASRGLPVYSLFLSALRVRPVRSTDFREPPLEDDEPLHWRVRFPGRSPPDPLSEAVCSRLLPNVALVDRLSFGSHYAETLRQWDETFTAARDEVLALGFDETFLRLWHFYLAYSRAGFASGYLDVQQLTFTRAER